MATISKETRQGLIASGLRVQIPSQTMVVRIAAAKAAAKGEDTVRGCMKRTLSTQVEIMSPESVEVGTQTVNLAGFKFFLVPQRVEPETRNETWAFAAVSKALDNSGFDWSQFPDEQWDDEHLQPLLGHLMAVRVKCEPRWLTRELTEIERGQLERGEAVPNLTDDKRRVHNLVPVADPATGQTVMAKAQDGYQLVARWDDVIAMKVGDSAGVPAAAAAGNATVY